jgi:hypothetical protein
MPPGKLLTVAGSLGIIVLSVREVAEILTWLCARPYGRNAAANRARRAVAAVTGAAR